jgi:hypothetical protein
MAEWMAFISWMRPFPRRPGRSPVGDELQPGFYDVSLQGGSDASDAHELGPMFTELADALVWAKDRTGWIVVRPEWDPGTQYWAGIGPAPLDDRRITYPMLEPPSSPQS